MQSRRKPSISRDLRLWCLLTAGMESGNFTYPMIELSRLSKVITWSAAADRGTHRSELLAQSYFHVSALPLLNTLPSHQQTIINSCSLSIKFITIRSIGKNPENLNKSEGLQICWLISRNMFAAGPVFPAALFTSTESAHETGIGVLLS